MQIAKSIVKVFSTTLEPDYEEPWRTPARCEHTGSGFVVDKGLVVTNAHVAANATYVTVRLATSDKRFKAQVHTIDHHCDLALLQIRDPEFHNQACVAKLGKMVNLLDSVQVIGFPMGGEELSITMGIVSRIELNTYEHAGTNFLTAQVDAAINAGNSGGPVFSKDKVVGIAFQGFDEGQNLGYMIPVPILSHFLTDALKPGPYQGFPDFSILTENMENKTLRDSFGMSEKQTGIRIKRVDPLCPEGEQLQIDDIILEIDGVAVQNDGTMHFSSLGPRIYYRHAFHRKFIGERAEVKIFRNKEIQTFTFSLLHTADSTLLIPARLFVKTPHYYIASGVVFQPVTQNYMDTHKGDELNHYVSMEKGPIALMAKNQVEDEIVFINTILESDDSIGYEVHASPFVKSVNGQPINCLNDVVAAMESNTEKHHRILKHDGSLIVIKNMGGKEHQRLLEEHGIFKDREVQPPLPCHHKRAANS